MHINVIELGDGSRRVPTLSRELALNDGTAGKRDQMLSADVPDEVLV